jgi:hypothetical protein
MSAETKVINVRVVNIRPQYNNLKEWMNDSNNKYIGRGGILVIDGVRFPTNNSIWANPYKIDESNGIIRDNVIEKYRTYITTKIEKDNTLKRKLLELRGKNLGCWCKPDACHGDVLVELIEQYSKEQ